MTLVAAILATACQRVQEPEAAPAARAALPTEPFPALASAATDAPDRLVADARLDREKLRAYRRPGAARPFATFDNPDRFGFRRVFLVKEVAPGWVHVYLPMRPNGATGWIRQWHLELRSTSHRVVVDLSDNLLSVFDGDDRVMRETVATGTGGTPTPTGLFYPTQLAETDPSGPYGPYIFGLSAYSEVLFSFAGGDGQVGIHGTNNPSLIGQAASHGCIRMTNEAIRRLANILPLGSPIRIRA